MVDPKGSRPSKRMSDTVRGRGQKAASGPGTVQPTRTPGRTEFGPQAPGSLTQEPEEVEEHAPSIADLSEEFARATYAGDPKTALKIWKDEHICSRCVHFEVCKFTPDPESGLAIVVHRCMAFMPIHR